MARISYNVTGQTSANFTVVELNSSTTYRSVYISVNGMTSGNLVRSGYNTSSNTWYVSSLSPGTTYYASFTITSSGGTTATGGTYITTESAPAPIVVGGVGSVRLTASSSTEGMLTATWTHASNAEYYAVEVYSGYGSYGSMVLPQMTTYSNTIDIYGLSGGSVYTVKVYGKRSGSSNGYPSENSVTMPSFAPGATYSISAVPSTTTAGRVSVYFGWATNATTMKLEVYLGSSEQGALVYSQEYYGTDAVVTGLAEYTTYTFKAYGRRSGYANGSPAYTTITTADLTPPVISSISGDGSGKMYLSFVAYDNHSGLRSTSRYYTEISSRNGTSYGQGVYHNEVYRSFTVDASGLEFVHDSYYYMRVTAYDNQGNSAVRSVRVQYKIARPNNWSWHTTKTAGGNINITASEWNSFCTRINQFRQYKSLSNYSFTTVSSGTVITASIVNQAVSAINSMVSTQASRVAGQEITASFFNGLANSLNSIT